MERFAIVKQRNGMHIVRPCTTEGDKVIVELAEGEKKIASSEHEKMAQACALKLNGHESWGKVAREHLDERKAARAAAREQAAQDIAGNEPANATPPAVENVAAETPKAKGKK